MQEDQQRQYRWPCIWKAQQNIRGNNDPRTQSGKNRCSTRWSKVKGGGKKNRKALQAEGIEWPKAPGCERACCFLEWPQRPIPRGTEHPSSDIAKDIMRRSWPDYNGAVCWWEGLGCTLLASVLWADFKEDALHRQMCTIGRLFREAPKPRSADQSKNNFKIQRGVYKGGCEVATI